MIISRSGWICSSLNAKQMNSVGRVLEYCPPTYFILTAWSQRVAALRGMQNSFQYWDSYIRSLMIFSMRLYLSEMLLDMTMPLDLGRVFGP